MTQQNYITFTKLLFLLSFSAMSFVTTSFAKVQFSQDDHYRYITSDNLPNHQTGQFPGPGNPNTLSAQNFNFRVTLHPQKNSRPTAIDHDLFGVAINGVVFDPATAEFWKNDRTSGWNKEGIINGQKHLGIDVSNGHVQPNGTYHYHGEPLGIIKKSNDVQLVGYAADGFPIYIHDALKPSYRLKKGQRANNAPVGQYDGTYTQDFEYVKGSGDLDECNGYDDKGNYYYVISNDFPMVPRCLMGTSDISFKKKRMTNMPLNNPIKNHGHPLPPYEAIQACNAKSAGNSCHFKGRRGENLSGTCHDVESSLACMPTR